MKLLVLNGPNLNWLGRREPEIYGHETMDDVMDLLHREFPMHELTYLQSNSEGQLIDWLQEAAEKGIAGVAFNAGAYTHTSIALQDCIRSLPMPVVEVHLSHVARRESFRQVSMIGPACIGVVAGFGIWSYVLAISALVKKNDLRE